MVADSSETRFPHVALFVHSMSGGGMERVMLGLASGLAERGMFVDLVLNRAGGEYIDLVPVNVRLLDLNSNRTIVSFLEFLRYLRREGPDVVLSTPLRPNIVALVAKVIVRGGLRVVVRQDSTFTKSFEDGSFRVRRIWQLLKWLLPLADCIVPVSFGVAEDLRAVAPAVSHKIMTIYNPVVWPDHSQKAAAPVEHPWFNDARTPVILSVGRLAPVKDQATLLRAFTQVVASRPAHLVILGEGPERQNLAALSDRLGISQHVDMPGFRINPYAYMSKSKVFVLSSRHEGLSTVLIEAMASGTSVVSTDCRSGPREILEDGKWGHLVPVGDWRAMAEAIIDTLDNPIPSGQLIARASDFSADASIDRYLEVLTGCSQTPFSPGGRRLG